MKILDIISYWVNRICGIIVRVLALSAVDRGIEPRSCQTMDYIIGICCFSAKTATLKRKIKDWLGRNQDNVSVERHVYPQTVVSVS